MGMKMSGIRHTFISFTLIAAQRSAYHSVVLCLEQPEYFFKFISEIRETAQVRFRL